jgi:hypothetical protein
MHLMTSCTLLGVHNKVSPQRKKLKLTQLSELRRQGGECILLEVQMSQAVAVGKAELRGQLGNA